MKFLAHFYVFNHVWSLLCLACPPPLPTKSRLKELPLPWKNKQKWLYLPIWILGASKWWSVALTTSATSYLECCCVDDISSVLQFGWLLTKQQWSLLDLCLYKGFSGRKCQEKVYFRKMARTVPQWYICKQNQQCLQWKSSFPSRWHWLCMSPTCWVHLHEILLHSSIRKKSAGMVLSSNDCAACCSCRHSN